MLTNDSRFPCLKGSKKNQVNSLTLVYMSVTFFDSGIICLLCLLEIFGNLQSCSYIHNMRLFDGCVNVWLTTSEMKLDY